MPCVANDGSEWRRYTWDFGIMLRHKQEKRPPFREAALHKNDQSRNAMGHYGAMPTLSLANFFSSGSFAIVRTTVSVPLELFVTVTPSVELAVFAPTL